jgi:hypothetical protein
MFSVDGNFGDSSETRVDGEFSNHFVDINGDMA